jgi:hypothetical protein
MHNLFLLNLLLTLILSSHLCSGNLSGFATKISYVFLIFPRHNEYCAHLNPSVVLTNSRGVWERQVGVRICQEYAVPVFSSLLPWEQKWKCLVIVEYQDVITSCMLLKVICLCDVRIYFLPLDCNFIYLNRKPW